LQTAQSRPALFDQFAYIFKACPATQVNVFGYHPNCLPGMHSEAPPSLGAIKTGKLQPQRGAIQAAGDADPQRLNGFLGHSLLAVQTCKLRVRAEMPRVK
jgi:hypothetical protein